MVTTCSENKALKNIVILDDVGIVQGPLILFDGPTLNYVETIEQFC